MLVYDRRIRIIRIDNVNGDSDGENSDVNHRSKYEWITNLVT